MAWRRTPRTETLSDEDLIARVAEADARAFEVVYERHSRAAYSLALRLLGDRDAADDLVQDAFLVVWRSAERYAPGLGSVRTWVLSIVHHRGVDRLRTASAALRRDQALRGEFIAAGGGVDAPMERALDGALSADLHRTMHALPPEQVEVLRLAYFGGFTHHEIAGMLGLPLGTVKGRLRLGLERLRSGLGAQEVPR